MEVHAQSLLWGCIADDFTGAGDIGPVIDAAMEYFHTGYTILCPALPVNGRVVREGCLYVNGIPLHESPMKDHPLTPMWASRISELMAPQGKYPCLEPSDAELAKPGAEVFQTIQAFSQQHPRFYIVPDFQCAEDAEVLAGLFAGLPLLTGGSGLAEAIGRRCRRNRAEAAARTGTAGKSLILAGICSQTTLRQIDRFIRDGGTAIKLHPDALRSGEQITADIFRQILQAEGPVLAYSSNIAENVRRNQQAGTAAVSDLLEAAAADLGAVEQGYTRIIVAGGETSGGGSSPVPPAISAFSTMDASISPAAEPALAVCGRRILR